MRTIPLLMALAGCGAPISNSLFYAEAAYLDALPTSARFAPPQAFLDGPEGDDPLLAGAERAATDLQNLLGPMDACGEALVSAAPDERGDTYRTWDRVPVLVPTQQGTFEWWVRGTVVREPSGAYTWTIDGAISRIGPWVELATGRHESSDAGQVRWRLDDLGALLGTAIPGVVDLQYTWTGAEYSVQAMHLPDTLATDPDRYWAVQGDQIVSWTDLFQVTADGATLPGLAVAGLGDHGGRADGYVWRADDSRVIFGHCWNADGQNTWAGGDAGTVQSGDEGACSLDPLLTADDLP